MAVGRGGGLTIVGGVRVLGGLGAGLREVFVVWVFGDNCDDLWSIFDGREV